MKTPHGKVQLQRERRVEEQKESRRRVQCCVFSLRLGLISAPDVDLSLVFWRNCVWWIMQGRAGRAARKDAVCETPQQGRTLGEMEVDGDTAAPVGVSLLCGH